MANTISHQGNVNQGYNYMMLNIYWDGYNKKKKGKQQALMRLQRKWNPCIYCGGNENSSVTIESSLMVPQKN